MALLIMIILFCLPICYLFLVQKHRKRTGLPPGPPGLPIIGNIHQYDSSNPALYLWKLSKQYGPIMTLRLGLLPAVVISSAKMAKEALKTHDIQFAGKPNLVGQRILSYNHLDVAFTPYSSYWREMRKICVIHLFSSNRVQQFRHVREDEVSRMIEKVSKSASLSKQINLSEIIMSLLCNNICRIAFSKRSEDEEQGGERSRFHSLLTEIEAMLGSFFFSDYFPFMGWVDKLTGMNRRLNKTLKDCDRFCQQLIDEHLDPKRPKVDDQKDIIDVLLQIQKNCEFKVELTWDHIKSVLLDVFVAGADTSAATLVWTMTHLMRNPEVMKKAQEEVRSVIKNKGFVDENDLQGLQYLKAVVKESFRLQPPIPLLQKATTEKCIIDGYEIPAKTTVYVNVLAIGRDTQVWDKPEEFIPERFIGTCVDVRGQHFELLPFGGGRRICPAISMAMATIELALSIFFISLIGKSAVENHLTFWMWSGFLNWKFDWEMHGMKIQDVDFDVLPGVAGHKKIALKLMATKFI